MWLSSTEPTIALWGGENGGGEALRTGQLLKATSSVDASPAVSGSSAAAAERFDAPPDAGGEGMEVGTGRGLLDRPVGVIRGQPGVKRHAILNNRLGGGMGGGLSFRFVLGGRRGRAWFRAW